MGEVKREKGEGKSKEEEMWRKVKGRKMKVSEVPPFEKGRFVECSAGLLRRPLLSG